MGKNTLHMIGLDTRGGIVLREKVSRGRITSRLANLPPCLIGIEAGMATHYVARELAALGHDVKQVPPTYAKPFRQGHKNDFRDAHAVAEAVQRPTTRFVPDIKPQQCDPNPLSSVHLGPRNKARHAGFHHSVEPDVRPNASNLSHGIFRYGRKLEVLLDSAGRD